MLRNARISPRKVRLSADLIRGRRVEEALNLLAFDNRRSSYMLRKVLLSAVANAQDRAGLDPMDLKVVTCQVDEGFVIKRYRPQARGRMHPIQKRCSHIQGPWLRLSGRGKRDRRSIRLGTASASLSRTARPGSARRWYGDLVAADHKVRTIKRRFRSTRG